jgi:DNA-binding response OmpR family regulator
MPLTILHVEDHRVVADAVRDTLQAEGLRVVTCPDGASAIGRLASDARYDLVIFDNQLPGADGLELVRYARTLPHRKGTPILMLSATEAEADARRAGADAYLRKPEGVRELVNVVKRLLKTDAE